MRQLAMPALVAAFLLMLAVPALAIWRGRDSRLWHAVSRFTEQAFPARRELPAAVELPLELDLVDPPPGWTWFQPEYIRVLESDSSLQLRSEAEGVWYENERGPMLWVPLAGDADIRVTVRTRKATNPEAFPDEAWQFGGVILRNAGGDAAFSRENYVFSVVGHRGSRLQVETKSTRLGRSHVEAFDWDSGDAELRIVRHDARFELSAREIGGGEWRALTEFDRPDLPSKLQLGLISYSYDYGGGRFDLVAAFDAIEVRAPE